MMDNLSKISKDFSDLVQGFMEYSDSRGCIVIDCEWDDDSYPFGGMHPDWIVYRDCVIILGEWDDDPIKSR
jgi:hypothetical protein